MTYIKRKQVRGYGPYYYLVKSVRHGTKVQSVHVRYLKKGVDTNRVSVKPACEVCGEDRIVQRHHRDGDHENKTSMNVVSLCPTCHYLIHHKRGRLMRKAGRWCLRIPKVK